MIHLRSIAAFAAAAMLTAAPVFAKTTVVADTMSGGSMHMAMKPACPPPARFGGGVYCGAPKLTNTLSLIVAGGGPAKFSTVTAFGKPAFLQYIKTFDFVISDSLAIVTKAKVPLPKAPVPDPKNGKALSAALYTDGVGPMGTYSVEYMLDHLVTHPIHVQVMKDIDAKYGLSADAAYHAVTLQIFKDLKAVYGL
jgi:hypothetical protein